MLEGIDGYEDAGFLLPPLPRVFSLGCYAAADGDAGSAEAVQRSERPVASGKNSPGQAASLSMASRSAGGGGGGGGAAASRWQQHL